MRIAFIVNNYPPRTGGVELHVHSLAKELLRLGHKPLIVTLGPLTGTAIQDGIEVLTFPEHLRVADTLGFPPLGSKRRLTQFLRHKKVDVVSVHTRFFPMTYLGYRAAKKAGLRSIHTEHGSDHVATTSLIIKYASRLIDFTVGRYVLRNADAVLGVSEEVRQFVKRLSGVEAKLFYNAIDLSPKIQDTNPSQNNSLVFVGRLVPGKGWEHFLEVVRLQLVSDPSLSAHVVGDGPDRAALEKRVRELGLVGVVQVHGRVPQESVREVLQGATLVNPTVLSEGFQTTLIEAIAEGGRVATFPVPGANLLREQGAPVRISTTRSAEALSLEISAFRKNPMPRAPRDLVEGWGWPNRAQEYQAIAAEVIADA